MTRSEQRAARAQKKANAARAAYYADELALPPECDHLCPYRPCFNKYENRGGFTYGRGYTSTHSDFLPACATRLCQGCPDWRNSVGDCADMGRAREHAAELAKSRKLRHRRRAKAILRAIEAHPTNTLPPKQNPAG